MSKPQSFKKIIVEDFDEKDRPLVTKLAYAINPAFEDVISIFNKGLSIDDNLNQVKKDITATVDGNGVPVPAIVIKTNLGATCRGIQVIQASNNTNPLLSPTSHPFLTFTDNSGNVSVSKITGLQPSNKYTLRLILYP